MGAFAICFEALNGFSAVRRIALKGKSGPCYDTGRRAVYCGEAAAVLDDDRHLIVGSIRVCEKTGGLYTLWPYLVLTGSDPAAGGGCCSSAQVGVIGRLVRAGALQSFSPPAPPDACTVTFYAFPGEIVGKRGGQPEFRLSVAVRELAASVLRDHC